jgi:hypothetical protein
MSCCTNKPGTVILLDSIGQPNRRPSGPLFGHPGKRIPALKSCRVQALREHLASGARGRRAQRARMGSESRAAAMIACSGFGIQKTVANCSRFRAIDATSTAWLRVLTDRASRRSTESKPESGIPEPPMIICGGPTATDLERYRHA